MIGRAYGRENKPISRKRTRCIAMEETFHLKDEWIERLKNEMGPENVVTDRGVLEEYDRDASDLRAVPRVMVIARDAEQISRLLALANRRGFPVVPRGAGTGLAGGCLTLNGGVLLSMKEMNRIKAIDAGAMLFEHLCGFCDCVCHAVSPVVGWR